MAWDNDLLAVDPLSDDAEVEQELIVLIDRMLHISDPLTVEDEDTQEPENNEESESLIK
ncbi:11511_t:CDS:2, partial [Paraglomus brasilianum]